MFHISLFIVFRKLNFSPKTGQWCFKEGILKAKVINRIHEVAECRLAAAFEVTETLLIQGCPNKRYYQDCFPELLITAMMTWYWFIARILLKHIESNICDVRMVNLKWIV